MMKIGAFAAALISIGMTMGLGAAEARSSVSTFTPTRFTVVDEGTVGKPDLLLIPGLTSGRGVWTTEAAKLAPNYRLHLVQVNGFAGQPAGPNAAGDALLPALVEQLHLYLTAKRMHPILIGHSLGGLLTLMLASKYPEDVAKMVIVDAMPFIGLMAGPQATAASVQPMAKAMRNAMLTQAPAQREAMEQQTAQTLVLNPDGRRRVAAEGLASDPHVAARAIYEDFQTDLRPQLAAITAPALILYAFDSTLTFPNGVKPTRDMADRITADAYRTMANAKLVRVDDTRHFIMFDQPHKLHAEIELFLK